MSNSPRRTAARPADRLDTARADLRKRYTTTWPDGTTEVVEETALEPHERALLDDPELHGALFEGLATLHLATPLDEDLLDPSQYTSAEAFPPGEYLRDELDEARVDCRPVRGDDRPSRFRPCRRSSMRGRGSPLRRPSPSRRRSEPPRNCG